MTVESAEPAMVASTTVPVTEEGEARQVLRLLEALDDHDDVQNVWSNFDIPDEVLAAAIRRTDATCRSTCRSDGPLLGSNACSSWASTPACPVAATGSSSVRERLTGHRRRRGDHRARPPLPERLRMLFTELQKLVGEMQARRRGGRAGLLPDQRPHRHGHGPGRRAGPGGGRERVRGGAVHRQRGQAGRGRLRWCHEGPGAAHGGRPAGAARSAPSPPDVADALALAVCHLASAATAAWPSPARPGSGSGGAESSVGGREEPMIGWLRGTIIARRPRAKSSSTWTGSGTG